MKEYSYSAEAARGVFNLFSQQQLEQLKHKYNTGGK
jgi:hypothetical protein